MAAPYAVRGKRNRADRWFHGGRDNGKPAADTGAAAKNRGAVSKGST